MTEKKTCANCLKTQHPSIQFRLNCKDCARGRTTRRTKKDKVPFIYQFFTGTVDAWLPRMGG